MVSFSAKRGNPKEEQGLGVGEDHELCFEIEAFYSIHMEILN